MKIQKVMKSTILWILIINVIFSLTGCSSVKSNNVDNTEKMIVEPKTVKDEGENYFGEPYYSVEDAKVVAELLLTEELKTNGYYISFDKEVEIVRMGYRNPTFYRFLIEDEYVTLETAILINKETGSPLICYPDDTYLSVHKEELFKSSKPIWYGGYGKKDAPDNYFTVLTISKSMDKENYLYVVTNSFYGAGGCMQKFDFELVTPNLAVYQKGDTTITMILNSDNTLTVEVDSTDAELVEMIDGDFL